MISWMPSTDELQLLVEQARLANPDAWEALYRHAYPKLHDYAARRLATDDQADDAVSETMTRAIDRIDAFTWTGVGIDGWLFGILRNVVRETYREGTRHPVVDVDRRPEAAADEDQGPAALLLAHEAAVQVVAAFNQLPDDDREVLELRVVGGLDAESVGQVVGRKAGAVRMAQSRALGKLRLMMGEQHCE